MFLRFNPTFMIQRSMDGGGGGGAAGTQDRSAEDQLVNKLRDKVAEQVRSAIGSDDTKKVVEGIISSFYGGMTPDAMRSALEDSEKVKKDVADIASQVEKFNQRSSNIPSLISANPEVIRTIVNERFADIEGVLKSKQSGALHTINLRAAEVMTTDNVIDFSNVTVEQMENAFRVDTFVRKRRDREYIFDVADRTTVSEIEEYKRWYEEGGEEGAFAIVEEGELKPDVSAKLVMNASKAKKIAGKSIYTDEVPKFRREAYRIIRQLINDKLLRDFYTILTAELYADATAYVGSALDGKFANPTDFHAMAAVAAQIEALNFVPDVIIINPQDKWRIGMLQDQTGQFYFAVPNGEGGTTPRMLGFNVVTSNRMPVGEFILGEAYLWKIEDEGVTIKIGYGTTEVKNAQGYVIEVQDDISHNRFRVISELFFHSYIPSNHTGSFVKANFEAVKELLQSEGSPEA